MEEAANANISFEEDGLAGDELAGGFWHGYVISFVIKW